MGEPASEPPAAWRRFHPAPTRPVGPGPRNIGVGNQRRTQFVTVQPQEPEDRAGEAGQQDQEAGQ